MEMQRIRYFQAVCDKGSFTRAAQSTYVAQRGVGGITGAITLSPPDRVQRQIKHFANTLKLV